MTDAHAKRDQNSERSTFRCGEYLPGIITKGKMVLLY